MEWKPNIWTIAFAVLIISSAAIATTATNAEGVVSLSGLKRLAVDDNVDIRVEQVTAASKKITISNINFTTTRIG